MSLIVGTYLFYLTCVHHILAFRQFSYHVTHNGVVTENHAFRSDFLVPKNTIHYTRPYSHVHYRQLCRQTQTSKGFKVGTIIDGGLYGDQRKNCYYLCDEDVTAFGRDSVSNPRPFFHCCPPGYSMDFDKQLCGDNDFSRSRRSQNGIKGGGRKGFHLSRQYINYVEGVRKKAATKPAVLVTKKLPGKQTRVSEPTIKDVGKCESEYKKHSLCNKYWQCVAGRFEVEMMCPSGLYWNDVQNHCDINRNVLCAKDLPSLNDFLDKRNDFHWEQTNSTLSSSNRIPSFEIPSFKKTNNKDTRIWISNQGTKGGGNPSKGERKEATKSASSSSSTATKTASSSSTQGWSVKGKWFKTISNNNKSSKNNGSIIPSGVRCLNKWQASFYKRRYGIDCSINHDSVTGFRKQFGVRRRFWKNSTKSASGTKTDDGTKNKPINSSTKSPIQTTKTSSTPTISTSTATTIAPTTTITSTEPEASTTKNPENNSSQSPTTEQESTPTSTQSTPSSTTEPTTQLTTNQSTTGEPTSEPTSEPSTTITSTTSQSTGTTDGESGNKTDQPVIDTSTPASTTTNESSTETTPTITGSSQSTIAQPPTTTTASTTTKTTESPLETIPTSAATNEPVISSTEEVTTLATTTTTTESAPATPDNNVTESSSETESSPQPTTTITTEPTTITTTTTATESSPVTPDDNVTESSSETESSPQPTTAVTTEASKKLLPDVTPAPETISTSPPTTSETSTSTITENDPNVTPITTITTTSSPPITDITLPSTVANNVTIETTTPIFDGTVKENGPCLHPGQRFKDEDDCQCFYECQFNRKLIRNCCPEGLLFNQNESVPDNNDESESDDSVCDLPENVQCTSIIS